MWNYIEPVVRALATRADDQGIPDITDPWKTKDVSLAVSKAMSFAANRHRSST